MSALIHNVHDALFKQIQTDPEHLPASFVDEHLRKRHASNRTCAMHVGPCSPSD